MTQEDIGDGRPIASVVFAAVKPAEFASIRIA
jgi:hypothetical protein